MILGVPRRALLHHGRRYFAFLVPALALVVTLVEDPLVQHAPRPALRGWLAEMWRAETGEWRLLVMHEPCGYSKLGGTLEARYQGELRECTRGSAIEVFGPWGTGAWLDADRVVLRCRGPTEPDPCPGRRRRPPVFE